MPSIAADPARSVDIDSRAGRYLCFPDVCQADDGTLVCAYNDFDQHAGERRELAVRTSPDLGKSWSEPVYLVGTGTHCPRLSKLSDGTILLLDNNGQDLFTTVDHGVTWEHTTTAGICGGPCGHVVCDRPLELSPDDLLTTGHSHRGVIRVPALRQPPVEQFVYRSGDRGRTWQARSVLAADPALALVEASVCKLTDGSLLALMRENSFVFEPMHFCRSFDSGDTWTAPLPTPLVGHRPTLGRTRSGRLLVTYRDVGPDRGTAAWLGTLEELTTGSYAVHGLSGANNPTFTPEAMRIANEPGPEHAVRYALRPMTDPEQATARLFAEVRVLDADPHGCAIHFGCWWRLFPDRIEAHPGADQKPVSATLNPGNFTRLDFAYEAGSVALSIDGQAALTAKSAESPADQRAVLFGSGSVQEDNGGEHLWRRVELAIDEPARQYRWQWSVEQGAPDAKKHSRVLELANSRHAHYGDFGYTGWCETGDGDFLCVFHHAEISDPGYEPSKKSALRGVWFSEKDFAS